MAPSDETTISINLRIPVWVYGVVVLLAWAPWLWKLWRRWWLAQTIVRRLRVGVRNINPLCRVLMRFTNQDTLGQPFPNKNRHPHGHGREEAGAGGGRRGNARAW